MIRKIKIKYLIAAICIFVLTIAVASTLYIRNVNFLTKITIISEAQIEISVETPLNKQIGLDKNNDTVFILKRPLKSIFIEDGNNRFEISSVDDLDKFSQKNEHIKIILDNETVSNSNVFFWYLEAHPEIKITLLALAIILLLTGLIVVLLKFIHSGLLLRNWKRIKYYFYKFLLKNNNSPKTKLLPIKLNPFNKYLLIALCITVIPILYTHLDRPYSYSAEEKKRALVAIEMRMQNDYIVPTLKGEPYCNKPPAFNWVIAPFIKMNKVEYITRIISVSFIILCAIALFFLIKRNTNWQHALLTSFLFLASGYILDFFTLFLYIDGLFVLLLLLMLNLNFYLINKEKYLKAFVIGYSLCALAFLTKGVPALWFQSVSIFSILLINKKLKILYSYKHFVGICIFIMIAGTYFYLYFLETNTNAMLSGLFRESAKVNATSFYKVSMHILTFPVKAFLPYVPIGLFLPLLFFRKNLIFIIKDKKLSYLFINLFVGISIFLSSHEFAPYYILMYIPFYIELILYLIKPFPFLKKKNLLFWNSLSFFRKNIISILLFTCMFIMGQRLFTNKITEEEPLITNTKVACENISKKFQNKKFYVFQGKNPISSASIFYLSYYSNSMVLHYNKCEDYNNSLLLVDKSSLWENQLIIDSIPQMCIINDKWEYNPLYVVEFDKSIANKYDEINAVIALQ